MDKLEFENLAQSCFSLPLEFTPYQLTHCQAGDTVLWLLGGSDCRIHVIALDEAMGELTMVCSPTLPRRAQEPTSTLTTRARRCSTVSSVSATCPSPTRVRSARGTCHASRVTRHLVMCQGGVLLQEVPGPGPGVQPQVPVSGRQQQ